VDRREHVRRTRTDDACGAAGEAGSLLEVAVETAAGGTVLRLSGEIDMSTVAALDSAIIAHRKDLHMLDVRQVSFIDCHSLELLFEATARARAGGRRLSILPGPALLRLVGLFGSQDALDLAEER